MPKPVKKKQSFAEIAKQKTRFTNVILRKPVWKGPWVDGITQSLLGTYLVCKERFRLCTIEGWGTADHFAHRIEYGQMWHTCEEYYAAGEDWEKALHEYCVVLAERYRSDSAEVLKYFRICKTQFPVYIDFWNEHEEYDMSSVKPIVQEFSFKVPYKLPSGRVVKLRGKWDSVDQVKENDKNVIYLQENKTKGDLNEQQIKRQLHFDMQTCIYLVALHTYKKELGLKAPIKGVRYNCVRRPLSGGRGTIRMRKATKNNPAETPDQFYKRLEDDVLREYPEHFFKRWEVKVTLKDLENFKRTFLNPVLENVLDDYEWWAHCFDKKSDPFDYSTRELLFPNHAQRHYRFPYGVWNPITDGGGGDLEEFMTSGSTVGLVKIDNLFPEL